MIFSYYISYQSLLPFSQKYSNTFTYFHLVKLSNMEHHVQSIHGIFKFIQIHVLNSFVKFIKVNYHFKKTIIF